GEQQDHDGLPRLGEPADAAAREADAAVRQRRRAGAGRAGTGRSRPGARGRPALARVAAQPRPDRPMKALGPVLAIAVLVLLLVSGMLYTVDQRQHAIVFQLGEIKEVVEKPGLHLKIPLLQNVRLFDMRILTYDDAEPLRFLTQGNRPVLVDSFVKWHIIDARQYYVSVQGDEFRAQTRIRQTVSGTLRDEFGVRTVREVVLAEAYRDAQRVRGEGDAKSAGIYAAAFSQNPEFFSFYRSMEAYRSTFRGRNDVMLLETNSDFLRYFRDSLGRQATPRK